ncbi:hypothetical protein ACIXN4_19890 [Bacteroides fragilis]
MFSVVSAGIYLKKGFFCQFEMFAPERANRDGEGERAFVDGLSILTPGDMKALSRRSEGFVRGK